MLAAKTFQDLEDTSHDLGPLQIYFEKSPNRWPIVRSGGEGYAAPVRVHRRGTAPGESVPHMLKIYHKPVEERRRRAAFLSSLDLPSLPLRIKLFEAAPTLPVSHTIVVPKSGEKVEVEGYLAHFVSGETFGEMLVDHWNPTLPARVSVARQLCLAVEVLERGGRLAHGDLSPGNLFILGVDTPSPQLRVVDFDGFHHPDVPPVPTGKGGRAWGTPGYSAPAFQRRDQSVVVDSDRVAMAILVMEIVTRSSDDVLPSDTLLQQDAINARQPTLPRDIVERWPAGWELVKEAIGATHPRDAPSPRRWRAALAELLHGGPSAAPISTGPASGAPGMVVLVYEYGAEYRRVKLGLPRGTFARVSSKLAWLSYAQAGEDLQLTGDTSGRMDLSLRQGSPHADVQRHHGNVSVLAKKGSVILWEDFEIYLD